MLLIVRCLSVVLSAIFGLSACQPTKDTFSSKAVALNSERKVDLANLWMVQFREPPSSRGGNEEVHRFEREQFQTLRSSLDFTINYDYRGIWNGYSIELNTRTDIDQIKKLEFVQSVYPVELFERPTSQKLEGSHLASANQMSGVTHAHENLGLLGRGIRIAVIDTGVDYHHPDLGGCFGPNCKVEFGHDFVGDNFNPRNGTRPQPDSDPDDPKGHGTHVAGIVGANGVIKGVAPEATLGAYKIFGVEGPTRSDITVAAIERAFQDNAQVVNASLGSAFGWPTGPHAEAIDNLTAAGAIMVASAGNEDELGLHAVASVGAVDGALSIASFDNESLQLSTATTSNGLTVLHMPFWGRAIQSGPLTSGSFPIQSTEPVQGCTALPPNSATGRVLIMRRGQCSYRVKAQNAETAGAAALLIYNNRNGRVFSARIDGTPMIGIPVSFVSGQTGSAIVNELTSGSTVTLSFSEDVGLEPYFRASKISTFSSHGPTAELTIKPDIGAPGGRIYSTYPLEIGSYATLQGTSMSSPHLAGVVALLKEARPNSTPDEIRTRLQNSAQPQTPHPSRGPDTFFEAVHLQGAGLADLGLAIETPITIEPSRIAFGEIEPSVSSLQKTITISNDSTEVVNLTLSHTPALTSSNAPALETVLQFAADVDIQPAQVAVAAGSSQQVVVTVTAPTGLLNNSVFGGYIRVLNESSQDTLNVPYLAFKGDYQSVTPSIPTENGFPWLLKRPNQGHQAMGATYTLEGNDEPIIRFYLEWPAKQLMVQLEIDGEYYSSRVRLNADPTRPADWSNYVFDGLVWRNEEEFEVPDGEYRARLAVLKALGDPSIEDHWQYQPLPNITFDRPNRAPEFPSFEDLEFSEGDEIGVQFAATDINSDPITYACLGVPNNAEFDRMTGQFTWQTNYEDAGEYMLTVSANDGTESTTARIRLLVRDVPQAPVFDPIADQTGKEGERLTFTVKASDPDGDNVYYSLTSTPTGALIGPTSGDFVWDVDFNQAGVHVLEFKAHDGLRFTTATATITIEDTNRPPVLQQLSNATIAEKETLKFSVRGTDPDGDELILSLDGVPEGATFSEEGDFSWTPTLSDQGTYSLKAAVSDGTETVSQDVTIVVTDAGDPPRAKTVEPSSCNCQTHQQNSSSLPSLFAMISLLSFWALRCRRKDRKAKNELSVE